MNKLIHNEIYKFTHKKSIKIIMVLLLIFVLSINIFYKEQANNNNISINYESSGDISKIKLNEYAINHNKNINRVNLNKMLYSFYDNYFLLF